MMYVFMVAMMYIPVANLVSPDWGERVVLKMRRGVASEGVGG